jgi:hypothetical protein
VRTYLISYTQTAYWTVEVKASSEDKAIEKAQKTYGGDTSKMEFGGVTEDFYQCEGES